MHTLPQDALSEHPFFLLRTISISLRDKKRRKEDAQQPAGIEPTISRVLLSALPLCYNRCQKFSNYLVTLLKGCESLPSTATADELETSRNLYIQQPLTGKEKGVAFEDHMPMGQGMRELGFQQWTAGFIFVASERPGVRRGLKAPCYRLEHFFGNLTKSGSIMEVV